MRGIETTRRLPHRALAIVVAVVALVMAACGAEPGTGASSDANGGDDCNGYPNQDIAFVVPADAGGGFDAYARLIAPYLSESLPNSPTVVVENRPGGGQLTGVTHVYGAEPDGYTIGITEPGVIVTSEIAGISDMEATEFTAIGRAAVSGEALVVSADSPWTSVEDMQAAAADDPLLMAHAGVAAVQAVTLAELDIPWEGVNHEGSGDAVLSIVRGDTDFAIFTASSLLEQVQAGDVKPLLIIGSKPEEGEPGHEEYVDVPTIDEFTREGFGAGLEQHRVVLAPPGLPDCVVEILSTAFLDATSDPELVEEALQADRALAPLGAEETQEILQVTSEVLTEYSDLLEELGE